MALKIRMLSVEESETIRQLAHSRTAAARQVERARIIWEMSQGKRVPAVAQALGIGQQTVRLWVKRFNENGLDGLADAGRSGRPATYSVEEVSEVIATALTPPQSLELPFGCWTLDRLSAYLNETTGIQMKRSRIDEILLNEGLRWRTQETWFGERVDPAFAKKRG